MNADAAAWDLHDASARRLTPNQEADLISGLAAMRAFQSHSHLPGCTCTACTVRRMDELDKQLRAAVARTAKAAT